MVGVLIDLQFCTLYINLRSETPAPLTTVESKFGNFVFVVLRGVFLTAYITASIPVLSGVLSEFLDENA